MNPSIPKKVRAPSSLSIHSHSAPSFEGLQTAWRYAKEFDQLFLHLAIRVHDFEIAERFLEERGVAWTGETAAAVGGGKVRSFCDPEGNLVQIVARSTDESCPPA
jgi:predicted enzyme related to lactoylglutathione lyase